MAGQDENFRKLQERVNNLAREVTALQGEIADHLRGLDRPHLRIVPHLDEEEQTA